MMISLQQCINIQAKSQLKYDRIIPSKKLKSNVFCFLFMSGACGAYGSPGGSWLGGGHGE